MFIAALFIMPQTAGSPGVCRQWKWVNKLLFIHTLERTAVEKDDLPYTATWVILTNVLLRDRSQTHECFLCEAPPYEVHTQAKPVHGTEVR